MKLIYDFYHDEIHFKIYYEAPTFSRSFDEEDDPGECYVESVFINGVEMVDYYDMFKEKYLDDISNLFLAALKAGDYE